MLPGCAVESRCASLPAVHEGSSERGAHKEGMLAKMSQVWGSGRSFQGFPRLGGEQLASSGLWRPPRSGCGADLVKYRNLLLGGGWKASPGMELFCLSRCSLHVRNVRIQAVA